MQVIRFLLRQGGRRFFLVALTGILSGASSAGLIAIINTALSQGPDARSQAGLYVAFFLLVLVAGYLSRHLSVHFTQHANHDLRLKLCREIVATSLRDCEEIGRDKLLATVIEDVQAITQALMALPGAFINLAVLAGCLGYLGWLSPTALGSLLLFLALAVVSVAGPERRAKQILRQSRADWNRLVTRFRDMVEGEKELRVHRPRRKAFLTETLRDAAGTLRDRRIESGTLQGRINSWIQVLYFVYIGILLFGIRGVETKDLIGYTLALLFIRQPLSSLVDLVPVLNQAGVALEHMEGMGLRLAASARPEPVELALPSSCSSLRVEELRHSYHRELEERSFALGPVDLELRSGEITFITGGNGSGKTTLIKLLVGLYTPEGGRILIDGREVDDRNREWYRQHFSVVFSDYYLFESLLGLGAAGLDEAARYYLAKLQLGHKVTVRDGVLSTRALSQGQRKRLALMTAYLEDRPIYVFDEWAADQDPEFKKVFYHELLPELRERGKMVIVISHDDRYFGIANHRLRLESGQQVHDSMSVYTDRLGAMPKGVQGS